MYLSFSLLHTIYLQQQVTGLINGIWHDMSHLGISERNAAQHWSIRNDTYVTMWLAFQTRPRHSLISLGIKTLKLKKKWWCLSSPPFLHRNSSKKPLGLYSSFLRDYKRIFIQHFAVRDPLLVELRLPLKNIFYITKRDFS